MTLSDDALVWLAHALGDLASARAQPGRQRPRIVAFHAQQAAEKELKAAFVLSGVDSPRTGQPALSAYAHTSGLGRLGRARRRDYWVRGEPA